MVAGSARNRTNIAISQQNLVPTSPQRLSKLTLPQPIWELAFHRKLDLPIHPRHRNRNRHRQHASLPSPTHHPPGLLLRRPHPHPRHHILKHHLPRLSHRIHRFRGRLRPRPRHRTKFYATSCIKESGSDSARKRD